MEWEPIRRAGKPVPRRIHSADRVEFAIPLSAKPPVEWSRFFIDELGRGARDSEGGPAPTIREDTVLIYPKRDALAVWVTGIDDLLERANKEYEDTVLSKLADERRQRVVAQERAESQMEQARREAEAIEEHPSPPRD